MHTVALESARLVLNEPERDDVPLITRYCQDPIFEQTMVTPWPYKQTDAEYFVNTFVPEGWQTDRELTWALRLNVGGDHGAAGTFLGVVGFRIQPALRMIDLGFWIGSPHRGRGYLAEAIHCVMEWIPKSPFAGYQGYTWQAIAGNIASARVAQKCGFFFQGVAPATIYRERESTRNPADNSQPPDGWHGFRRLQPSKNEFEQADDSWQLLPAQRIHYPNYS